MAKATYSRRGRARRRGWRFSLTPILVAVIVLALLGYFFLSAHGPILIHHW